MKFYTRVLGGRDYSLLETIHFGLRLPATLSSFGDVRPISISDWSVVKPGSVLKLTHRDERATFKNKREIFDNRQHLSRPNTVEEDVLKNLSMYAFWRLFDVVKGKLVRKQKEQCSVIRHRLGTPCKIRERMRKARRILQANSSGVHAMSWSGRHVIHCDRRSRTLCRLLAASFMEIRHGSKTEVVSDVDRSQLREAQ